MQINQDVVSLEIMLSNGILIVIKESCRCAVDTKGVGDVFLSINTPNFQPNLHGYLGDEYNVTFDGHAPSIGFLINVKEIPTELIPKEK